MENGDFLSRRKHPRHALRNAVSVVDQATGEPVGTIANLSLEGMMLVNNKPLHTDCIYQLCLNIPEGLIPGQPGGEIRLGVDCLWNSPAESVAASTYWSGCQIIDISEDDFAMIRELIASVAELKGD